MAAEVKVEGKGVVATVGDRAVAMAEVGRGTVGRVVAEGAVVRVA